MLLKQLAAVVVLAALLVAFTLVGYGGDPPTGVKSSALSSLARSTSSTGVAPAWGHIKGRIVFDGVPPGPELIAEKGATTTKEGKELKDAARCAEKTLFKDELAVNKDNKGITGAVVSVVRPAAIHPDLAKVEGELELGQEYCAFKPRVLAMREGQKLMVSSSDPIGHNANFTSFVPRNNWNQLIPSAEEGGKRAIEGPKLLATARPIKVACNIHGWMGGWILVFDHPYFAVTDENGAFEIKNVPAGTVKLLLWQEKCLYEPWGREGHEVEVNDGQTTDLGTIATKPKTK